MGLASLLSASCSLMAPDEPDEPENAIKIGALLPFSGSESAIGRNLEQAMLLAVEDLTAAGGLEGRPFDIVSRDSHSNQDSHSNHDSHPNQERGLDQLLSLIYTDGVDYLVGPEENELAREIAFWVKKDDLLHMLPGYAAPSIARREEVGGKMRLAPSPFAVGCALAKTIVRDGVRTANSLSARDDYNAGVSTEFTTHFAALQGRILPSVTFTSGQPTYERKIEAAFNLDDPERAPAGRTLLAAYPAAASTIVTEWTVHGRPGRWLLGPALHTEVFLANIPQGTLDDNSYGISPSLSLRSECSPNPNDPTGEALSCTHWNADAFAYHFSRRWNHEVPFPAAHFYYDGVVLIAMGLVYGYATTGQIITSGLELRQKILELNDPKNDVALWWDLSAAMAKLRAGTPLRYIGAAAEYEFDTYGASQNHIMQKWTIQGDQFVDGDPFDAKCMVQQ
ncbi:ABC transporter substrate-binding protein [Sorangium sp. So ce145]|uniref:ABC transporter substrate-binding protein n=1 Tax=Sorangium sp. So ce145 TaxID=3133285 RepID=UPI003F62C990